MDVVRLQADQVRATLDPEHGGRLSSLRIAELEVIGSGGSRPIDWGCYAMVPFAGRIRDGVLRWQGRAYPLERGLPPHAIHGVGLDRPWEVLDTRPQGAVLRRVFDERWPWPGQAIQRVDLTDDTLTLGLEVHADNGPMPAWIGFHPWFARQLAHGGPAELDLPASAVLPRDAEGLPTPTRAPVPAPPWDDTFPDVTWPVTLTWPGALRVQLWADHPWAVVFTERESGLCVEPQTGPPNAAELGLAGIAEPGRPVTLTMTWRWNLLAGPGR